MKGQSRAVREKPSDFLFDPKDSICLVREIAGAKFAKAGLNAVHTLRRRQGAEMTSMHLRENMYMVTVYLTDHPEAQDVWKDGRHAMRPAMKAGAISLFDMRHHWEGDNMAPFEALNFFVPDLAFDETARELGSSFSAFSYDVEREYRDDVVTSLARAVLPALERPAECPTLFVDQVFSALRTRLLVAYCGLDPTEGLEDRSFPTIRWPGLRSFFSTAEVPTARCQNSPPHAESLQAISRGPLGGRWGHHRTSGFLSRR